MYAKEISGRDIAAVEDSLGRTLDWWSIADCIDANRYLSSEVFTADGTLLKPLTAAQERFIHDERLRCQFDAIYWLERYAWVRRDDVRGGEGIMGQTGLWESQKLILDHISAVEVEMWASYDRQIAAGIDESMVRVAGIRIALLKGRQLGATVLILLLLLHRFIFWTNLREIFASTDATKTLEAFDLYWLFAYARLPVWMRPPVETKSKDFGMRCETLDTTLFLQNAAQESGVGMGGTSHCGLITEVGLYPKNVIEQMQNHFFRSIPWSLVTFVVLESLAQGQGNFWHQFSLAAIRGGDDAGSWHGIFVPWYIEPRKYREEPPVGWRPSDQTLRYAYKVLTTSERWCGRVVELDLYQMRFYEKERAKAESDGALEDFLTNYPATPEEAFQSKSGAPFSASVLERLSNDCRDPIKQFEWLGGTGPGDRGMRPADLSINPDDPRGVVRIYKKPDRSKRYKMGIDTAPGIEGWSRRLVGSNERGYGDRSKDNAAIEIIEVGQRGEPDEQVAEFIAPINYVSLAPIANWLGRLFRGRDEEMCEAVVETGPTSGEALQERLINEYGYWNLYRKANMATYGFATSYGWVPNEKTRLDLWYRTRPHISYMKIIKVGDTEIRRVKFIPRSRYLVDIEFRNCEIDKKLMTAKAAFSFHDDATRAIQMAIYIAHDWQSGADATTAEAAMGEVPRESRPDYQASDMTREEMIADVDQRLEPEGGEVW